MFASLAIHFPRQIDHLRAKWEKMADDDLDLFYDVVEGVLGSMAQDKLTKLIDSLADRRFASLAMLRISKLADRLTGEVCEGNLLQRSANADFIFEAMFDIDWAIELLAGDTVGDEVIEEFADDIAFALDEAFAQKRVAAIARKAGER